MRKISLLLSIPALLSSACTTTHGATGYVAFGGGSMEHKTNGSNLDDKTSAGYFALGGEAMFTENVGGGVRLEGSASDDDLFADLGPTTVGEAADGELFFHGTARFGEEQSPLPLRFGFFFRGYTLQDNADGDELSWSSFGPRLEFAPDIQLAQSDEFRWSLPLRFGLGVGLTTIETSPATEEWDTTMTQYDLGLATRFQFSKVFLDVGYLLRHTNYSESDETAGFTIREADATFSGLVFTFGAKF